MFSACLCGVFPGTPASSRSPKACGGDMLISNTKLAIGGHGCDRLATCPECTLPIALRQLG